MTLATVQIILASLGFITGLLIALLGPGKRWIRWPLAIAAGAGVAVTGWSMLWLEESSPIRQLHQSLLLSAVIVLIALLTMMLLIPSKRSRQDAKALAESGTSDKDASATETASAEELMGELAAADEPGRDAINIDLEQNPNAMIANQDEHALMHLLGPSKATNANTDTEEENLSLQPAEDEPLLIEIASDVSLIDPTSAPESNRSGSTADVVSLAERREQQAETAEAETLKLVEVNDNELELVGSDELDLADSDELYQAMRDAEAELDLSDDGTWLNEDTDIEIESESNINDLMDETTGVPMDIEDAEILEIVDDIEHDTAALDSAVPAESETTEATPATLKDALSAQRQSINQLSTDTDVLAERLSEWQSLSDDNEKAAWTSSLLQGQTVQQQQRRILAENNFRQAAVELIHTQRDVMKQLMNQLSNLGAQREQDLETLTVLQEDAVTQRRLASQAALLARKAAADKRALTSGLSEERRSHERTKGAARRAMGIARDAVDKLAEHEKRLGLAAGESANPDTKR